VSAGRLTTHVLDTATGKPAQAMRIDLFSLADDGSRRALKSVTTNADGRIDGALLAGDELVAGVYQLEFHAGAYLAAGAISLPEPAFLDIIPLRFGIADVTAHYHVPLLLSPYGYSTYRGS